MPDQPPVAQARHTLPPLILHPFSDSASSLQVLESAKAAAQMILDGEEPPSQAELLRKRLLDGRYAELRMLLFVGKDIFRWLGQCLDFSMRHEELKERGLTEQSFAEFLIARTPPEVEAKLRRWGVADYSRIFARAIGIYAQFQEPPPRETLSLDYLRNYYRYADYAYNCWKDAASAPALSPGEFDFSLYASGEYSKLLEDEWDGRPGS